MTRQDIGRLDAAIDQTIQDLLDQSNRDDLRARVLSRLSEPTAGAHGSWHSPGRRVAAAALAISAVVMVGRFMLAPPADTPPAADGVPEVVGDGIPALPGILSSRGGTAQGGSVGIAMPPGGSTEDAVVSARSAAPAVIADAATIMHWDGTVLHQGRNLWTCLPDRFETPVTDPWCLVDTSLIARWSQAVRVGGNIPPPERVIHAPPVYPPAAQDAGQSGFVVLGMVIGPNGRVGGVQMLASSGHDMLDQAAFEGVLYWSYDSTVLNGRPVPVIMTATVNFTLR